MLENIFRISKEQILDCRKFDNYLDSDEYIRSLGPIDQPIIAFNPNIKEEDHDLIFWLDDLTIADKCLIINWNNSCIAKIFPSYWNPNYYSYQVVDIEKPKYIWHKNSDLDKLMKFKNDPIDSNLSPWDKDYELVWYLDPRVNPTNDKIWVYRTRPLGRKIKGIKDMGFLMPDIDVEFNQEIPQFNIDLDSNYPNYWDLHFDNVLMLDSSYQNGENLWAVKFSPNYRKSEGWRVLDEISPIMTVTYNSVLGNLDYDLDHQFSWADFEYEHIWLLDRSYLNEGEDDIWAFKITLSNNIIGTKVMGYISPKFNVKYNKTIPNLNYDIDYNFKWHDLKYKHVWLLDRSYLNEGEDDIWAFKLAFGNKPNGTQIKGYISPTFNIEYNRNLSNLNYDIDYSFKWHDLKYEHVWLLDRKHMIEGEDDIWAFKLAFGNKPNGTQIKGYISPTFNIEYNRNLPNFNFNLEYSIPWYDLQYLHIWYLDESYHDKKEKIWNIKLSATDNTIGEKESGKIVPLISNQLDVIFISYKEPNAEKNWQRVLEKAPWAKRVSGVSGIFNAHREAAKLSSTDMFYVVDGDAYLVDDWNFDFQPNIFDRDCAYVWASKNPINNLVYQNGGVKLFSKHILMKKKTWKTLDMFTGIMPNIKSDDTVSCITLFNVDPFSTWRSAFRECVKLYISNQITKLNVWASEGENKEFGKYAIEGANDAILFAKQHSTNYNVLLKINDYEWLKLRFNEIYNNV